MRRRNGEVWRERRNGWKVQFKNGTLTLKTKREADLVSRIFYPGDAEITVRETVFGTGYSYPVHKRVIDLMEVC